MAPVRRGARRRGEHGQVLTILALSAVVLLGVTALAVDLGLQTQHRRDIQNISDAASMAGAQHLTTSTGLQSDRIAGALDALKLIHHQLGLSGTDTGWASGQSFASCVSGGTTCVVSVSSGSASLQAGSYTVVVASPPLSAAQSATISNSHSSSFAGDNEYFQVDLTQQTADGFGAILPGHFLTSTEGAHSVALHTPSNQHFGFGLYSQTFVGDGNADEVITGNIYAAQYINPASSGQSSVCASGGAIVLGSPQSKPSATVSNVQATEPNVGPNARTVTFNTNGCTQGGGIIEQTLSEGCSNIPNVSLPSGSYVDDPTFTSGAGSTKACVAVGMQLPSFGTPSYTSTLNTVYTGNGSSTGLSGSSYQPGLYEYPLTVSSGQSFAGGYYIIEHQHGSHASCDLCISQPETLSNVTFILLNNSFGEAPTVSFSGNGTQLGTQTPYCPDSLVGDCVFPIWAPSGVAATVSTSNNGLVYAMQGTVYMPSGTFTIGQNSRVVISGQAIVDQWSDQSGFHPDPSITYNGNTGAPEIEQLRVVE